MFFFGSTIDIDLKIVRSTNCWFTRSTMDDYKFCVRFLCDFFIKTNTFGSDLGTFEVLLLKSNSDGRKIKIIYHGFIRKLLKLLAFLVKAWKQHLLKILFIIDNSWEQYTDTTGTDLDVFFAETLNKNLKDRNFLLEIESLLVRLAKDKMWVNSTTLPF